MMNDNQSVVFTRSALITRQSAFELAVAERLGIDPTTAVLNTWRVEDEHAYVTLDFPLVPDELLEMFNTGKVPEGVRNDFIEKTVREAKIEALREMAESFRTDGPRNWGHDAMWLTTGNNIADVAGGWCDEKADELNTCKKPISDDETCYLDVDHEGACR